MKEGADEQRKGVGKGRRRGLGGEVGNGGGGIEKRKEGDEMGR